MEETETTLRKRTLAILHREIWFRSWSGRRAAGSCSSADLVSYTVARSRSASTSFTSLALNNPPPPALAAYGTLSLHGERGMGSQSTSCRHREVEPRTTSFIASLKPPPPPSSLLLLSPLPRSPQDFSISTQAVWPFLTAASVAVMPSVCVMYTKRVCVCLSVGVC